MNFVNKKHAWNQLSYTLVDVSVHNLVDLVPKLLGEVGLFALEHLPHHAHKVLASFGSCVRHIEVVESDILNYLFLLVHVALGKRHKLVGF